MRLDSWYVVDDGFVYMCEMRAVGYGTQARLECAMGIFISLLVFVLMRMYFRLLFCVRIDGAPPGGGLAG